KNKNKHPNKKKASLDENRLSRKGFKGWANCSGRNLNTRAVALPHSASLIAIYTALLTLEIDLLFLRISTLPKCQLILAEILHLQVSRV
ncbi:hypothetical protein, partial [Parashewanella curva]|uniref:hypothetical protein n=1 Tax=Parashewanella curva TaxID=2338552 RepID=UPI001A9D7DAF